MHQFTISIFGTILCWVAQTLDARLSDAQLATLTSSPLLNATIVDGNYQFSSTGIPDHPVGNVNPNDATVQDHRFNIPMNPSAAEQPGCLGLGTVGLSINGVPLYNPYTGNGHNAVEGDNKEIFDDCLGHPSPSGSYHYHQLPICLWRNEPEQIIGIALDGYLVFGPLDKDGNNITNSQLDACHGMTVDGVYRYIINYEFPYIMGCYHGNTLENNDDFQQPSGEEPPRPPPGDRPPPPDGSRPPPGGMGFGGNVCVYANVSDASGLFASMRAGEGGRGGEQGDGGEGEGGSSMGHGLNAFANIGLLTLLVAAIIGQQIV